MTRRSVPELGMEEGGSPGSVVGASMDGGLLPQGGVAVVVAALGHGQC